MVEAMEIQEGFKQTEVGVIPSDWDAKPLGAVLKVRHGKSQKEVTDTNGEYPILASGGVIGKANRYLYNKPSVLIGRKGTIDKPQFMTKPFWSVDTLFYTEVFENYSPEFLYYNFLLIDWYAYNEASGVPSLNAKTIEQIPIPLPPTKTEQTAIATALNDADALITQLEKLIAKKRAIKQGAMQELLKPKEGWVTKKLRELAQYRRGSFPQPYGLPKWYEGENAMPFVQVFDVGNNMKLKETTKQQISDLAKSKSVFVEKGTVILTIQGSIGRIAITQYDSYIDRTLLIFTNYLVPMDKVFFMYIVFQLFQIEKQKAPGGTIKTITKEELSDFDIHYPDIHEQKQIAHILSDMDTEIEALKKKLEKYKMLKQGMMQVLLTGRVRLI